MIFDKRRGAELLQQWPLAVARVTRDMTPFLKRILVAFLLVPTTVLAEEECSGVQDRRSDVDFNDILRDDGEGVPSVKKLQAKFE